MAKELLSDLFQRVLPFAPDSKPHPDHSLLLGRKRLQDARGFVADVNLPAASDQSGLPTDSSTCGYLSNEIGARAVDWATFGLNFRPEFWSDLW